MTPGQVAYVAPLFSVERSDDSVNWVLLDENIDQEAALQVAQEQYSSILPHPLRAILFALRSGQNVTLGAKALPWIRFTRTTKGDGT
jgi:hypothetical protein